MELKPIKNDIRSCNNCSHKNYTPSREIQSEVTEPVQLYDLIIGNMCIALCPDCLSELSEILEPPCIGAKCCNCRNLGLKGFSEAYCLITSEPITNDEFDEEHECEHFDSRYIEFPINVTGIEKSFDFGAEHSLYPCGQPVLVRPCDDENKVKTYFGILLGDLPIDAAISHNRTTGVLNVATLNNPAIFVPELKKIVYGCESWWARINSLEEAKSVITDSDIENCWYVKLMRELLTSPKESDVDA